ncbi:MAG: hypothetical protein AAB075_10920, partial [Gemmatimonadota bacterium]
GPPRLFGNTMNRAPPLVLALLALSVVPAQGQTSVSGIRDLAFGALPVGITTTILPTDPVKSGQWNMTSPVGSRVFFRLTLPSQLNGPAGATMPVDFRNGDAFILEVAAGAQPDYFNPGGNVNHRFIGSNQAIIRLGGRATPALGQRRGAYSNTVILTISLIR